jgi:hypothetical protein
MYESAILQLSDTELRQVFGFLNSRQIALGVELGALTPGSDCGYGVEGFGPPVGDMLRRIKDNGGVLRYVAMDEPFYFGSLYAGPGACRWTAAAVASNVSVTIAAIRAVFPTAIFGDIEPVPAPGVSDWLGSYSEWIDAYQAAMVSPLAFFHADMFWDQPTWRQSAGALTTLLATKNIAFGIIYNGSESDRSDAEWLAHTESAFVTYEVQGNGPPAHVIFQSWSEYPRKLLPETDVDSFTYTINRYFRTRTRLSLTANGPLVAGFLTADQPVAGALVRIASDDGGGSSDEPVLAGRVPAGADSAVVGFRVNMECDCGGNSDFTVSDFEYSDRPESFVTLGFESGLDSWDLYSTGKTVLQRSDHHRDTSPVLHVAIKKDEVAMLNSQPFGVRPDTPYFLKIGAVINPKSAGSGYFTVIFLSHGVELSRQNLSFGRKGAVFSTVSTAPDGFFVSALEHLSGGSRISAEFGGDERYWPAQVTLQH